MNEKVNNDLVHELAESGFSMREIAKQVGLKSTSSVHHILKQSKYLNENIELRKMISGLKAENKALRRKISLLKFYLNDNLEEGK